MTNLTSGLTEVQEMFTKFEALHRVKFGEVPVFETGVQGYKELLCFDAKQIAEKL